MEFIIVFVLLFAVAVSYDLKGYEIKSSESISQHFEAQRDVRFLVFTHLNPSFGQQLRLNDIASVRASNYDARRPTRFIIHGFQSDSSSDVNVVITAAYLRSHDVNVVVVDWGLGANTV